MIGKWGTKRDGSPAPGVKTLTKPLTGLLYGERGTKQWKQALDRILLQTKKRPDMTVSQIIEEQQPALWVHGHTHDSCDYHVGATRVVCNPKGYEYENKAFDPELVVRVGA